ncbi:MAG: phage terminase small subunit-related protein [Oscillospiraceae bacterium]|nr:phage terminase small subunit-related protein [Oscillospiraceae bacterium]
MARDADIKAWERQEGESNKAYEAFSIYRDMGNDRTLISVAEQLHKSYTLIRRWKTAWNWEDRAREYDNELIRAQTAKAKKEAADAATAMRKRQTKLALELQNAALSALTDKKIKEMEPKDIIKFIAEATRLERINREGELNTYDDGSDDYLDKLDEVLKEIKSAF